MTVEHFKVERFKADFPDLEFPVVRRTVPEKCADLKRKMAKRLGLPTETSPLRLLESLYDSFRTDQTDIVATDPNFNLGPLLKQSGIKTPQQVYINWDRFDHVDQIAFIDLLEYFHYLWYSVSDDVEIFDDDLRWVALIRHDGAVRIINLTK
jgi:hypothetical protein